MSEGARAEQGLILFHRIEESSDNGKEEYAERVVNQLFLAIDLRYITWSPRFTTLAIHGKFVEGHFESRRIAISRIVACKASVRPVGAD